MDYATAEPALAAWCASLTGVSADCVLWENAPRVRHNGQLVTLSWVSATKVGTDDARWEYDAGAAPLAQMNPVVTGPRLLVLQVTAETYNQTPGQTARAVLERMRDRLRAPSSVAALRAANLGLVQGSDVRTSDYRVDSRVISQAILEVSLNASTHAVDTGGQTSYINTVDTKADIVNVDGSSLPVSLQPDGVLP